MTADIDILHISAYFTAAGVAFLCLYCGLLRIVRRSRPRLSGDGFLVLHSWGPRVRAIVSFLINVLLVLPILVLISTFALGGILGAIEGWDIKTGFEYVLCNIIGIGPIVVETPTTITGLIADIVISMWALLLTATILGLAASLGAAIQIAEAEPPTPWGLIRTFFIYIPVSILLLALLTGGVIAALEDWAFVDGFLFMIGAICGIEDPLTASSPETDNGNFFAAICYLIELCVGGVIIGIVGAHPVVARYVTLVEGDWSVTVTGSDPEKGEQTEEASSCRAGQLVRPDVQAGRASEQGQKPTSVRAGGRPHWRWLAHAWRSQGARVAVASHTFSVGGEAEICTSVKLRVASHTSA